MSLLKPTKITPSNWLRFGSLDSRITKCIRSLDTKWKVDTRQTEIMQSIIEALEKVDDVVLEAPTGIGKSLIGVIVSKFFDNAYLVTAERMLQRQYEQDFDCDVLMGADNYNCHRFHTSAAAAMCRFVPDLKSTCQSMCAYSMLRKRAQWSKLLLTNYHYLALEFDYVRVLPKKQLAIFDEAHSAESVLYDYAAVNLGPELFKIPEALIAALQQTTSITFPKYFLTELQAHQQLLYRQDLHAERDFYDTIVLFEMYYDKLLQIVRPLRQFFELHYRPAVSAQSPTPADEVAIDSDVLQVVAALWNVERILCKWENYTDNAALEWIIDHSEADLRLIPTVIDFYSKRTLQASGSKRLWMSATIGDLNMFASTHGLQNFKTFKLASPFPAENRPVYLRKAFNVNAEFVKSPVQVERLATAAFDLCKQHATQNGIIHSGTYALTSALQRSLEPQLMSAGFKTYFHNTSKMRDELVSAFLRDGGILVSPTIIQGLDFKDDASRFQIILKVPYLSLLSSLVRWKLEHDPDWYANKAAIQIIQALGRSIRHEQDHAVSYILDQNILSICRFFPDWMHLLQPQRHPTSAAKVQLSLPSQMVPVPQLLVPKAESM